MIRESPPSYYEAMSPGNNLPMNSGICYPPVNPTYGTPQQMPQQCMGNYINPPPSVVHVVQIPVAPAPRVFVLGPDPVVLECSNCGKTVQTKTTSNYSGQVWLWCCILCIIGLPFLAWIPFCTCPVESITHKCPVCNVAIGTYVI